MVTGPIEAHHPALFMTWSGTASVRPVNPRQTSAATASEYVYVYVCVYVCVCVCCVGAECAPSTTYGGATRVQGNGQKFVSLLDREMRPVGKQLGWSLALPEQWERRPFCVFFKWINKFLLCKGMSKKRQYKNATVIYRMHFLIIWRCVSVCVCVEPIKLLLCPLQLRSVSLRTDATFKLKAPR